MASNIHLYLLIKNSLIRKRHRERKRVYPEFVGVKRNPGTETELKLEKRRSPAMFQGLKS